MAGSGEAPFHTVADGNQFAQLLQELREHRNLRGLQLVQTTRADEEGEQQGYDARLILQGDVLSAQPLELYLQGIGELSLGAGLARATGGGQWGEEFLEIEFDAAVVRAQRVRYRMMPRDQNSPGSSPGSVLH